MASRKQERERLRAEREKAEATAHAAQRKRLLVGYVVAGLISAAVLAGIVVAIIGGGGDGSGGGGASGERINAEFGIVPDGAQVDDRAAVAIDADAAAGELTELADEASCELKLDQPDEGANHIDPKADPPDYRSDPPTSGNHSPEPLTDGAFAGDVPAINSLHALEHGRVAIQYVPELPDAAQGQLLALFDESPAGMTLFPNETLPYEVAATAWRNTLGCESFQGEPTLAALRAFRDEYRGRGPEPVPLQ